MDQLLSRPEIQSAVAPFIVALACYLGLKKFSAAAWIWALFTAFLVAASLINGAAFTPLTGTRKIILLVLASCLIAGLVPAFVQRVSLRRGASVVFGVAAVLWVFWKVVARMEVTAMISFLVGGVVLVLSLTWLFGRLSSNPAKLQAVTPKSACASSRIPSGATIPSNQKQALGSGNNKHRDRNPENSTNSSEQPRHHFS